LFPGKFLYSTRFLSSGLRRIISAGILIRKTYPAGKILSASLVKRNLHPANKIPLFARDI